MTFMAGETSPANSLSETRSPNLLIPDNDANGVTSVIHAGQAGVVDTILVSVFVIHSWISDLHIVLRAPDGTEIVLHDHAGNDGDDIDQTWRSADFPALAALQGTQLAGDWTLHIIDKASEDVGRLVRWSLDIAFEGTDRVAEISAEPNVHIPDNQATGISDSITNDKEGALKDITVALDIEHSYIGDLVVDLSAPTGSTVRLHNNEGAWQANIRRSYESASTTALQSLIGEEINGDWTLRVRDLARVDTGTLRRWSVTLRY